MSDLEQITEVTDRMDTLRNIAAKAWPNGVIIGWCRKCLKERNYDWDAVAKMMSVGLPRCKCCDKRIDLR